MCCPGVVDTLERKLKCRTAKLPAPISSIMNCLANFSMRLNPLGFAWESDKICEGKMIKIRNFMSLKMSRKNIYKPWKTINLSLKNKQTYKVMNL